MMLCLFYLLVSVLMYLSYKRNFVWNGDDIYYQFQRLMGLSNNYQGGLLFSNISTTNFGNIGYGVNIFYPWLTLLPFYFLFHLTGNWISAYYLGLLFFFFISLLISHYAMKKFSGSTKLALLFAMVYNFSNYRLIELFTRASLAEYIATIFLPLCFLGFYELFFGDGKQWKILAIGMSLIIFTHVLSTFLCIIMFVLIMVIFVVKLKFSKQRLFNLLKAVVSTILMTLIFTVPFISEELFQKYGVPDRQILQGQDLGKLLYSSLINDTHRLVENNAYNIGLILLIAMVLGIIVFKKFSGVLKATYLLFIGTFLLSTSLFPWKIFQNTSIEVIQFPYRLLMFTTLFGSVVMTYILAIILKAGLEKYFIAILGVVTVITGGLWLTTIDLTAKTSLVSSAKLVIDQKRINEGNIPDTYLAQYVPVTGQKELDSVVQHQVFLNGKVSNQAPLPVDKGSNFTFTDIKKGDKLDLPFVRYKYTKASLNGKSVPITLSKRGSVMIKAPKDYDRLTIHLTYGNRKLFGFAMIVTIISWFIILFGTPVEKYFYSLRSRFG